MIRDLISAGKIKEANEKLFEFISLMKDVEVDSIQLLSRTSNLRQQEMTGTINSENKTLALNQLTMTTLFQCSEMEKYILEYFPTLNFTLATAPLEEQLALKLMGKYEEVKKVIDGTSTVFFRARQVNTKRYVMLRVSKMQNFDSSNLFVATQERVRLDKVFRIKHRNIIKVLNADLSTFPGFLVLEHINGVSLDHLINTTPFSTRRVLDIFKQLAQAIYYLHINQISHKNIKPDKVLIDNELVPVISAFDIVSSSSKERDNLYSIDQLLYASPELLKDEIDIADYQSDQFSLGLLMYELITGNSIFCTGDRSAHHIVENRLNFFKSKKHRKAQLDKLSDNKNIKAIITKMLSESPRDRFDSMRDVIQALEKIKLPTDESIEIALDSYERCCIVNPNFVQAFYQKLFSEGEHKDEISAFFKNKGAPLVDKKRSKMLRVAIDLLIHCKSEPEKLKKVLQSGIHSDVQSHMYQSFTQTIISTVAENDPLWKQESSRKGIETAWNIIAESVKEVLQPDGSIGEK